MRYWWNIIMIFLVIVLGAVMFVLKYHVIEKEKELAQIHKQISTDKREIHMLNADWALLNDPERLRVLVEQQTKLKVIKAKQIVDTKALPNRTAGVPMPKPKWEDGKK